MFMEDFCRRFSISLYPYEKHDDFYDIDPSCALLKKYLLFNDYSFFRYTFDQKLSSIIHHLILNGKAYLEIVKWTDKTGQLQGIEFVPIGVKHSIKIGGKFYFFSKSQGQRLKFKIDEQSVVVFRLKDLGFRRKYFLHLLNKMSLLDITATTALTTDESLNGIYDFTEHQRQVDFCLLKYTRKIYWLGRSYSNQHLSESYLLYRMAHYKMLRFKFLDYILRQINNGLEDLQKEFKFDGKIVTPLERTNFEAHLREYYSGRISASQLSDILNK